MKTTNFNNKSINYSTPINYPYFNPNVGEITLLAISPNKIGDFPDEVMYNQLKDCSFNAASIWLDNIDPNNINEINKLDDVIDKCANNNIVPFIKTSTLQQTTNISALLSYYNHNSKLGGWSINTPNYDELYNSAELYKSIWEIERMSQSGNPNSRHIIIMNSLAQISNPEVTYRDYIITFQNYIEPSFWATSVYPIGINNQGANIDMRNLFYKDLQIFSLVSKYCERPFWYTVRCQSYEENNGASTPYPTEEEIRFSAFSALAYGAQGLQYWSFRQRENETLNGVILVKYIDAPIGINGTINKQIYDAIKTVNNEIKVLNDIFYNSYLVEVRHTGSIQYEATSMLKGSIGPLESFTSQSEGVLISHLNTNGKDYLVIVNHAFNENDSASQSIGFIFSDEYNIYRISINNGYYTEIPITTKSLFMFLKRGQYIIFRWC